ncbi:MAG: putative TIM-barrel fold metal-dependent hydrolase [Planctomycetota bacterium]
MLWSISIRWFPEKNSWNAPTALIEETAVIDFHIAYSSIASFEALASQSPEQLSVSEAFSQLTESRKLPSVSPDEHLSDWLKVLDAHGISHAICYASHQDEIAVVAEAAHKSAGRLLAFSPFNPVAADATERAEHLLAATGFRGLVLDPGHDGYLPSDSRIYAALKVVESHSGIVVVNCGIPHRKMERAFGIPISFDPNAANPLHLMALADRFPNLTFVVPRFGSGFFRELLMVGAECPNVWVDSSSSNKWMQAQPESINLVDVMQRTISVFGPERVLFGSNSDDPKSGWKHTNLTLQREALGASGISEAHRELIFNGNARKLMGLPVPEAKVVPQPH